MNFSAVILGAGRGKRMRSLTPKVLHEILGKPVIQYTIDAVKALRPERLVVVVGNKAEEVKERVNNSSLSFTVQRELLGTGNALLEARKGLRGMRTGTILVLNGDSPLITSKTLRMFLKKHKHDKNDLSVLSFVDDSRSGYGRVLRKKSGTITGIVEDRHAKAHEKKECTELNSGIYAIETGILRYLHKLKKHRTSGEYYLTDIVGLAARAARKVEAYECPSEEVRGINTRMELHHAIEIINRRNIKKWLSQGVTFIDPRTAMVHSGVSIGKDTVIYPNTCLEGNTSIGKGCMIFPGARIYSSKIANYVLVKDCSLIEESNVRDGSVIGPYAHLRPSSTIGRSVKIGNFVEIKKSTIGDETKISHLSYIGDAIIGKTVNIGAGTITCNYDGRKKSVTEIGTGGFVGTNCQLIAPVKIGKGAYVAAGSTVTRDVPDGALAISRVRQTNIKGWATRRTLRAKADTLKMKTKRDKP
jgi:bifunctional UDP-N-acetylglucosamine pyrophosphorylase/glucosamine-1-phosphate N-acetyltransferase